jgi:hypothetical protein
LNSRLASSITSLSVMLVDDNSTYFKNRSDGSAIPLSKSLTRSYRRSGIGFQPISSNVAGRGFHLGVTILCEYQ